MDGFLSILKVTAFSVSAALAVKAVNTHSTFSQQAHQVSDDVIWGLEFLPNQSLIFTEKKGAVRIWDPKTKVSARVGEAPDTFSKGQAGLLDIKLHPDFASNGWVYVSQSFAKNGRSTTRLLRFTLRNDKAEKWEVLFTADAWSRNTEHYGSRLAFDRNKLLYMSIGERNERDEAQNLASHKGKILRLTEAGKPAPGNPFEQNKKAKPEIFSYGHRNPQGLAFDAKDVLWEHEHGPRGGDEINIIEAGKNYGWPVITYGREYWGPKIGDEKKEGMEQPLHTYIPSIAPSGLMIYSGAQFPEWRSQLFIGALVKTHVAHVEFGKNNQVKKEGQLLSDLSERIRDLEQSPDGRIFAATDSGKIIWLQR